MTHTPMIDEEPLPLPTRLNLETGRIGWAALGPFFARGKVIEVTGGLDLVAVAAAIAQDDTPTVQAWLTQQQVRLLPDAVAKQWAADDQGIWAVVVAPWVVAQKRG